MTIVLEHQFWGLEVSDDAFAVTLSFSNEPERLRIPFEAVIAFADPSVRFGLQFDGDLGEVEVVEKPSAEVTDLPVDAPTFHNPTEIIPAAELEERLAEAERINDELSQSIELPPDLETAELDLHIKGINFEPGGLEDEAVRRDA